MNVSSMHDKSSIDKSRLEGCPQLQTATTEAMWRCVSDKSHNSATGIKETGPTKDNKIPDFNEDHEVSSRYLCAQGFQQETGSSQLHIVRRQSKKQKQSSLYSYTHMHILSHAQMHTQKIDVDIDLLILCGDFFSFKNVFKNRIIQNISNIKSFLCGQNIVQV